MEWLSWIGGGAGIVALIKAGIDVFYAKPNRDKLEVDVLNAVIERLDTELERKSEEFTQYKQDVNNRVAEVKREVMEERRENANFRMAIYQAYRCKLYETPSECPVISAFESCGNCEECKTKADKD